MRVELLYADDDPASMPARQNLVEVLTEDAFETPIQMIVVASDQDAATLGMRGSPTILVDGVDIDPGSAPDFGMGTRTYLDDDGQPASVPGKRLIRRAVERARGWGHGRAG